MDESTPRERRPSGSREAWIVGSGTASLVSALYLVKYAQLAPPDVHILDEHLSLGECLHRQGDSINGYDQFAGCLPIPTGWRLKEFLSLIPSRVVERGSLLDDIQRAEAERSSKIEREKTCFIIQRKGCCKHLPTKSLDLGFKNRFSLVRLMTKGEKGLRGKQISEVVRKGFFESTLWIVWSAQFGFQPWHCAAEFRRSIKQYLSGFRSLNILSCLDLTGHYQFESIYLPIYFYLQSLGVDFQFDTKIKNIEFSTATTQRRITHLTVSQNGLEMKNALGPNDVVIASPGSTVSGSAVGTNNLPPAWSSIQPSDNLDENWSLWLYLGNRLSGLGNPYTFCTRKSESMLESFTITTDSISFFEALKDRTQCSSKGGAIIRFSESSWGLNLCFPLQPVFSQQPQNIRVLWGFAQRPENKGDYVNKTMIYCSGSQLLEEILHHLKLPNDIMTAVSQQSITIPRAMPRMTSTLLRRGVKDRPCAVPKEICNLGLVGPFVEVPVWSSVDMSYVVETARVAVSRLFDVQISDESSGPSIAKLMYTLICK